MKNYQCSPEVILRTPMNSFMELVNSDLNIETFRAQVKNDLDFKESVLISSPGLYREFFENFDQKNKEDQKKLTLTSLRGWPVCAATNIGVAPS